jgi:hypothetical protein
MAGTGLGRRDPPLADVPRDPGPLRTFACGAGTALAARAVMAGRVREPDRA